MADPDDGPNSFTDAANVSVRSWDIGKLVNELSRSREVTYYPSK